MKKLLTTLAFIILPLVSQAATSVPWSRTGTTISPWYSNDSVTISSLGGSGTRCLQVDNTGAVSIAASACGSGGGGGSGGGTWATTTSTVANQLINYSLNNTDIVTIGNTATTSAKFFFDPNTTVFYLSGNGTTTKNFTTFLENKARNFTATSTSIASTFPYASTTAISATTASTSNLYLGIGSGLLKVVNGLVSLATLGTDYLATITASSPLSGSGTAGSPLVIANAAADGTTKGAASFTAADFDATTGNISIDYTNGQKASGSVPGFLTAADWTTFNNKQPAGSYLTSIGSGTNGQIAYWSGTNLIAGAATGTASCSSGVSCTSFTVLGSSPSITNSGVTSIVAGTGISISGATGAVTINSSGGTGTVATSSNEIAGQIAMFTTTSGTPAKISGIATTTASCSGSASCTPFTVIGSSPVTITATGGAGGAAGTWSTTTSTVAGRLINYPNNTTDIVTVGANATTTAKFFVDPNLNFAVIPTGKFGVGTTSPTAPLTVEVGNSSSTALFTGSYNGFQEVYIQNRNAGNLASSDLTIGNDRTTGTTYYTNLGQNSSTNADPSFTVQGENDSYLYSSDAALDLGTASTTNTNAVIKFFTGGSLAANERMRVSQTGNIGIGTTSPYAKLSINGQTVGLYFTATSTSIASVLPYASTTGLTIAGVGGLYVGTLTGPLQAISGKVTASSTLSTFYGGTGVSSFGQGWINSAGGVNTLNASTSPTVNYITATSTTFASQLPYASSTMVSATTASTTNLIVSGVKSAIHLSDVNGVVSGYAGTSCTNQFARSLSALGVATCASVANTDLTNSSVTINTTGGITGGGTVSLGGTLNLNGIGTTSLDYYYNLFKDWKILAGVLTPTTTLGIQVNASSTIVGGLTVAGNATTTNLVVTGGVMKYSGLSIATTTTWTGSTTEQQVYTPVLAETWLGAVCNTLGAGTVNVQFYNNSAKLNMIPASSTPAFYTFTTNNSIAALATTTWIVGTPASTPTSVHCDIKRLAPAY